MRGRQLGRALRIGTNQWAFAPGSQGIINEFAIEEAVHRVGELSARLARKLGLPGPIVDLIRRAAPLHDLGKIGPQHRHILNKQGSLTHEEHRTMRAHPAAGAQRCLPLPGLRDAPGR